MTYAKNYLLSDNVWTDLHLFFQDWYRHMEVISVDISFAIAQGTFLW